MARGIPIVNKEKCKGCGLCIANCPVNILSKTEDVNSQGAYYTVVTDESKCIACQNCVVICPDVAITLDKVVEDDNV